jgi:hypothetical protein
MWSLLTGHDIMLSEFVKNRHALQALTADRHLSYYRGWHMWTVTLPRRSITGRLVWGKVWRRRDNGRWIYKKYIESPEAVERWRAVRTLVSKTSTNNEQSAKRHLEQKRQSSER